MKKNLEAMILILASISSWVLIVQINGILQVFTEELNSIKNEICHRNGIKFFYSI